MNRHFGDRLSDAVRRTGSCACVGLDPRPGSFPPELRPELGASRRQVADAIRRWAMAILSAIESEVPVVKLQSACFEAWGPQGVEVFADVCLAARTHGLLVIGDCKRGDIGSSADLYAQAYLAEDSAFGCDALTVNPYLGLDSLEPLFTAAESNGRGVFVLCKTSNRSSADFQDWKGEDGHTLFERVAGLVERRGASRLGTRAYSSLGLVVGATYPEEAARVRAIAPHSWFLVPGYGHQGGTAEGLDVARAADGLGILVSSSRGITEAWQEAPKGTSFVDSIKGAVARMKNDLKALVPQPSKGGAAG